MRRFAAAVGATLTACALTLGPTAMHAAAATPQADAALRYLYTQVGSDGSVASALGATEDVVISVADNGYDPATLHGPSSGTTAYSYLTGHSSAVTTAGGAAKYVLAWLAAGQPMAIGGGSALLTKLNTLAGSGGYLQSNGTFHATTGEPANAYSQALGVLADLAGGHALPANAVGWLTCAQRPDGGFGAPITDTAATPPVSCGSASSDTNATGMVLQALGRDGLTAANSPTVAAAVAYLKSLQHSDGGFGFGATDPSDPDSDALVIQGLVAVGEDPTAAVWSKPGGANPLSNMETFADTHSGGYVFPGNATADAFTTSGIPQALALKPYGAATTVLAGSAPPAAPVTSPTPAPTNSAGPARVPVPATGTVSDTGTPAAAFLGLGGVLLAAAGLRRRAGRRGARTGSPPASGSPA